MTIAAAVAEMQTCPRWDRCSANVCPLDPDWRHRSHADGESVCSLAQEVVKPGAGARLAPYVREEVIAEVRRVLPEVGTSTDCTEIYIGDFTKVVFVMRERPSVMLAKELFALNGQVGFVCHVRADVAVQYPAAFSVVTGVRP